MFIVHFEHRTHLILIHSFLFGMCRSEIMKFFRDYMKNNHEILSALDESHIHLKSVFEKCSHYALKTDNEELLNVEIETVIDFLHEEINTGHWSDVSLATRRAFSAASFMKCFILLKTADVCNKNFLRALLKILDTGILLGAPLKKNRSLLTDCASFISKKLTAVETGIGEKAAIGSNTLNLKRKLCSDFKASYDKVLALEIDTLECPSLQSFNMYFTQQIPLKLTGCMTHWPAMEKWHDLNYFLKLAGDRTVPVETGKNYADEEWSQKLITLKQFITDYFLERSIDTGYLAQHNLFDQITELKEDIRVPEYCCMSENFEEDCEPDINAWFGPEGTVSPLHYDPKNNLLAQVFGSKQIILFSPQDSKYLYPYEDQMLFNTAQVDVLNPNLETFPLFKHAKMFKCLLEPGEILFIPPKWWHHVTALEKSFSVSFWWQ